MLSSSSVVNLKFVVAVASEDQHQQESTIVRLAQFRQTLIREKEECATAKKDCEALQVED